MKKSKNKERRTQIMARVVVIWIAVMMVGTMVLWALQAVV